MRRQKRKVVTYRSDTTDEEVHLDLPYEWDWPYSLTAHARTGDRMAHVFVQFEVHYPEDEAIR